MIIGHHNSGFHPQKPRKTRYTDDEVVKTTEIKENSHNRKSGFHIIGHYYQQRNQIKSLFAELESRYKAS